jgi:hypothetical protein
VYANPHNLLRVTDVAAGKLIDATALRYMSSDACMDLSMEGRGHVKRVDMGA